MTPLGRLVNCLPEANRQRIRVPRLETTLMDGIFDKIGGAPASKTSNPVCNSPECKHKSCTMTFIMQVTPEGQKTNQLFVCKACGESYICKIDYADCKLGEKGEFPISRIISWSDCIVPIATDYPLLLKSGDLKFPAPEPSFHIETDGQSAVDDILVMVPIFINNNHHSWTFHVMKRYQWATWKGEQNPTRKSGCCIENKCFGCALGYLGLELKLQKAVVQEIAKGEQFLVRQIISRHSTDKVVIAASNLLNDAIEEQNLITLVGEKDKELKNALSYWGEPERLGVAKENLANVRASRRRRAIKGLGLEFKDFDQLAGMLTQMKPTGLWICDGVIHFAQLPGFESHPERTYRIGRHAVFVCEKIEDS